MPTTVGFGKLRRKMLSNRRLPPSVRLALIEFKGQIRRGDPLPRVFENREGGLPRTAAGQIYYEFQVGEATAPIWVSKWVGWMPAFKARCTWASNSRCTASGLA